MIAALYVLEDGPYADLPNVEVWGVSKDARGYPGPHPVVAHPPCARWGRYWGGGPNVKVKKKKGDDGGCFQAALQALTNHGGVLEHPEASAAWPSFHINRPPKDGGWVPAGLFHPGKYTCCVEQGHYGHRARKATWLLTAKIPRQHLPELTWGPAQATARLDQGFHSTREHQTSTIRHTRITPRECLETPTAFRDLLLHLASLIQQNAPS